VRTRDAAAARLDLYASIRSFVARAHPGPIAAAQERHAAWFVSQAERAAEHAHRDLAARAWLLAERDNVLAVVTQVLSGAPVTALTAEPALRALVALSPLLLARGALASVAALVAPVVDRTRDSGADPRLAARAMLLRGALRRDRGDLRAALKDLLGAESIARALGDELLGADLRIELGRALLGAGEIAPSAEHFERAAGAFATLGARAREAHALAWLAIATATGPAGVVAARPLLERAVALAAGDHASRAPYLVLLGRACGDAGDAAAAKSALQEAIASAGREQDARTDAAARLLLGIVLHDAGELAAAVAAMEEARDRFAVHGLEVDAATARGHLGLVACERGRGAEGYALLADARDVAMRAGREGEGSFFSSTGTGTGTSTGASASARDLIAGWDVGAPRAGEGAGGGEHRRGGARRRARGGDRRRLVSSSRERARRPRAAALARAPPRSTRARARRSPGRHAPGGCALRGGLAGREGDRQRRGASRARRGGDAPQDGAARRDRHAGGWGRLRARSDGPPCARVS